MGIFVIRFPEHLARFPIIKSRYGGPERYLIQEINFFYGHSLPIVEMPLYLFFTNIFILFYFILFYFILFYFILFYFILFYFILFYFTLLYFILFYFTYF